VDISRQTFDNLSADPMAELLVGHGVTFTVDTVGEVSGIKPLKYFEGWDQSQQFVESLAKGWYAHLPGKSVPVGGTWAEKDRKDTGVGGMDVTTNAEYRFRERKKEKGRDCAFATADIKSVFSGKSVNQMGSYDVAGGGDGDVEFLFDPATSVLVRFKAKMTIDMKLSPESGAANAVETHVTYHVERELL
jgi:hypothetical protein